MGGNQNLARSQAPQKSLKQGLQPYWGVCAWPGNNKKVWLTFDSGSGIQISFSEILPILCNIYKKFFFFFFPPVRKIKKPMLLSVLEKESKSEQGDFVKRHNYDHLKVLWNKRYIVISESSF